MIFLHGGGELPHKAASKEGGIFSVQKKLSKSSQKGVRRPPVHMRGSRVTSHETSPGKGKLCER